jgi:hypothetical protein
MRNCVKHGLNQTINSNAFLRITAQGHLRKVLSGREV